MLLARHRDRTYWALAFTAIEERFGAVDVPEFSPAPKSAASTPLSSTHFFAGACTSTAREVSSTVNAFDPSRPRPRLPVDQASFAAGTRPGHAIRIGSADEPTMKVVLAHEVLGIDRFFGQADWGGMPRTLVEESIARLATEIAPATRNAMTLNRKAQHDERHRIRRSRSNRTTGWCRTCRARDDVTAH
nr:hypothetical protein JVH1_4208 [Rhodococcus sp. JVH1]